MSASAEPTTPPASSEAPSPSQSPSAQPSESSAPPSSSAPPPSSSAPPPSSSASASQSASASASQSASQSASASASESESASASASSSAASSSASSSAASSAASSSAASSAASSSAPASETTASSAIRVTTTDGSGRTLTTAPPVVTNTLTSTDANGAVFTVTQIVHNPNGGGSNSAASSGPTPFLQNTSAVAGTFVAVGLVVTGAILAFIFFMLKRRRRQRLDRDVAAAAAAAAAASGHQKYEDEDEHGPAMTQYAGYYAGAPGIEVLDHPQPSMGGYDYEDPTGGYDRYATDMNNGANDRMSTATAPGLAGFGAQRAQDNYLQAPNDQYMQSSPEHEQPQQHQYPPQDQSQSQPLTAGQRQSRGQYYFDPNQAFDYADDDYNGYDQPAQPHVQGHNRSGSEGSVAINDSRSAGGLKVTNF